MQGCLREWLAGATAAAVALLVGGGCTVPSTLGLACNEHVHCDQGQFCEPGGSCVQGTPPVSTDSPTLSDETVTMTGTGGGTSTGAADSTGTPVGDTSSGTGTSSGSGEGSTGPSCGAASGTCDTLDILFVVDNSGSMSDDFSVLIPAISNINALLGPIVADLCSYHMGVTTTEPAPDFQPKACQVRGALSRSGALAGKKGCFPNDPDHPAFLTEQDPPAVLGCLMTVGQNNDDDEKQIDTTLAALGPELAAPGACNEGFLREGVPLLIVILTDEDDDDDSKTEDGSRTGSEEGPSAWYDALTAIKPASDLGVVIVAAETKNGDCDPWVFLGGSSDGEGAEDATRLRTLLAYFTGSGYGDHTATIDICGSVKALQDGFLQFSLVQDAVCADAEGL